MRKVKEEQNTTACWTNERLWSINIGNSNDGIPNSVKLKSYKMQWHVKQMKSYNLIILYENGNFFSGN